MSTPTADPAAVRAWIAAAWSRAVRPAGGEERPGLLASDAAGAAAIAGEDMDLPAAHTVPTPGRRFHRFFYWDTYYTSLGLWAQGDAEALARARGNADCMLHLVRRFGFVPNYTQHGHEYRSQPPHAALQVRECLAAGADPAWAAAAYEPLAREWGFWHALRRLPGGLNRYGHHASPWQVEAFGRAIARRFRQVPDEPGAFLAWAAHALAEAESGWDFTPRFAGRCLDAAPVDLNSLLFAHEQVCGDLATRAGDAAAALRWRERAEARRRLVDACLWDEERGLYLDWDAAYGRRFATASCATFYPLWLGLASPAQARRVAANLPLLERAHGLLACAEGPRDGACQWDAPNAWAPCTWAAVAGLARYGFHAEARRLAAAWVATVARGFAATGTLWEKYHAVGGGTDAASESAYEMPEMLGWTAGVFIACQDLLAGRPLPGLTTPD